MALAKEFGAGRLWRLVVFLALAALAIAVEAAPLGIAPGSLPSPDLVYCVIAHGALMAPASVPVLLIFGVGLARDLLTDVPVGLGALTLILAAEALKARAPTLQRQPLLTQWLWVAGAAAAMTLGQWLVLTLTLAHAPALTALFGQFATTVLVYPFVTLALRWVLRMRDRPRSAEPAGSRQP